MFIEGDGNVWSASDPTPNKAVALDLYQQYQGHKLYLGRPCMFIEHPSCTTSMWTTARYSAWAADETRKIMQNYPNAAVIVGFSGGAAIAAQIAAKQDVRALVSVSGNLSLKDMREHHNSKPLTGSVDPMTLAQIRAPIKVIAIGRDDKIVPKQVASSFQSKFGGEIMEFSGNHHSCMKWWPKVEQRVSQLLEQNATN